MTNKYIADAYVKWLKHNKPKEPTVVQISMDDWNALAEAICQKQPALAAEMLATREGHFINAVFTPNEQLVSGTVYIA